MGATPEPQPQPPAPSSDGALAAAPLAAAERPARIEPSQRFIALLEVVLCSDFPTQFALAATFYAIGFSERTADGSLSLAYIATLSLVDAVLLIALIVVLLRSHGESPREVFFGRRRVGPEARLGIPLAFVALAIALTAIAVIRQFAPWLRTEEQNPLQDLLSRPGDAAIMAVVLVVAGGIREEVQRAFLMRRFEIWLGGPVVGVIVASAGFGAGHVLQGKDVAIVTGVLGAFWAVVYLRRRSIVAPVVSHSGFNLLQVAAALSQSPV
jgi:membrane protease YdiL (CAAX protease family)